jgi:hypothetical protein
MEATVAAEMAELTKRRREISDRFVIATSSCDVHLQKWAEVTVFSSRTALASLQALA